MNILHRIKEYEISNKILNIYSMSRLNEDEIDQIRNIVSVEYIDKWITRVTTWN